MGQLASGAFDGSGAGVFPGGAQKRTIACTYSVAANTGAIGSLVIGHVPLGVTILGGYMNVSVAPVGAGASIGVTVESAGDIVAVAAINGAPWSTTGKKAIVPKANTPESTSVTTTAERDVLFVVSAAVLTAGTVVVYLEVQNA